MAPNKMNARGVGGKTICPLSLPLSVPLRNDTGFEPLPFTCVKGVGVLFVAGVEAMTQQRAHHELEFYHWKCNIPN